MSPRPTPVVDIRDDDDLREYIMDTIARLERLAERLEVFAEERFDAPATEGHAAESTDPQPGE